MPSIWDINQEHKLLLSVIEVSNIKAINWALVAEKMGTAFTNEACRSVFESTLADPISSVVYLVRFAMFTLQLTSSHFT